MLELHIVPTNSRAFGSFNFCTKIPKCAKGYRYKRGGIRSWSNVIGGYRYKIRNIRNTEACAQRCKRNSHCKAYLYSPRKKNCYLANVQNPTYSQPLYGSFNFCSKILANADSKCANGYRYNKGDVSWSNVIGGSGNVMRNVQNTL